MEILIKINRKNNKKIPKSVSIVHKYISVFTSLSKVHCFSTVGEQQEGRSLGWVDGSCIYENTNIRIERKSKKRCIAAKEKGRMHT